jgi:hypothetical protein
MSKTAPKLALALILVALFFCPSDAKADSFVQYTLQGFNFLSGTFTLDIGLNTTVVDWNIVAAAGSVSNGLNIPATVTVTAFDYTPTNSGNCVGGVPGGPIFVANGFGFLTCPGGRGGDLVILAPFASLSNPAGGTISVQVAEEDISPTSTDITPGCTSGNPSNEPCVAYFRDNSGTLVGTPITSAPEPGSLGLLALGLVSIGGLTRKRKRA